MVLVAAGRHQVWHLMRTVLLFAALVLVLMGLGHALLRRLGSGRHRVVETGVGLRLVRWWGTHEVLWVDVERVDVEDGSAAALWKPVDPPPRAVFVDRGGRRWRVPFAAVGGELALQRQRLTTACAAHGVEVRGAAIGDGERRRSLGGGRT